MHAAYVPVPDGVSSLHSNVAPASDVKVNDGAVCVVAPLGPPVIVVSGAAGVDRERSASRATASALPAPSIARTENV